MLTASEKAPSFEIENQISKSGLHFPLNSFLSPSLPVISAKLHRLDQCRGGRNWQGASLRKPSAGPTWEATPHQASWSHLVLTRRWTSHLSEILVCWQAMSCKLFGVIGYSHLCYWLFPIRSHQGLDMTKGRMGDRYRKLEKHSENLSALHWLREDALRVRNENQQTPGLYHSLLNKPLTICLTALTLSFHVYKLGLIIATSQGCY